MRTYVPVPQAAGTTAGKPTRALRRPGGVDAVLAIGAFLKASGKWLLDRVENARRREIEAYLSRATDAADLEARIRRLERGVYFSRYY
jgi:hypothetical protein